MKSSKSYCVLFAFVILLLQNSGMAKDFTLTEFLSDTVVGKSREALSEAYGLEFNPKYNYDGAIKIGKLQYGNLDFIVQIYVNEKECIGFKMWASQFRGHRNGKTVHGDAAEIDDVFRDLLRDLERRYAKAPPLYLHKSTYEGSKDISYMWVNKKYILVLSEWNSMTTKEISLTHGPRNSGTGEFSGTPEEHRDLQENRSGKLPDDWPNVMETPEQMEKPERMENGIISPTSKLENQGVQSAPEVTRSKTGL